MRLVTISPPCQITLLRFWEILSVIKKWRRRRRQKKEAKCPQCSSPEKASFIGFGEHSRADSSRHLCRRGPLITSSPNSKWHQVSNTQINKKRFHRSDFFVWNLFFFERTGHFEDFFFCLHFHWIYHGRVVKGFHFNFMSIYRTINKQNCWKCFFPKRRVQSCFNLIKKKRWYRSIYDFYGFFFGHRWSCVLALYVHKKMYKKSFLKISLMTIKCNLLVVYWPNHSVWLLCDKRGGWIWN